MQLVEQYPIRMVCRLLKFPRSQLYRSPTMQSDADGDLKAALLRLAGEWPTYGYRRLCAMLRREGWQINSKRVRRVLRELGLQRPARQRRVRTTNSEHGFPRYENLVENLKIERIDQVGVADITYIRLRQEFVYLAVVMDVFSRRIRGWELGRNLDASLTKSALNRALEQGCPEIHHSDQGVQYAAFEYIDILKRFDVSISMARVGEPRENGFAERLMRTIKEEEVALNDYQGLRDARQQLERFIEEVYNHKRIHSSLGYLTPAEFEEQHAGKPTAQANAGSGRQR
jgi:putative transposase